MVSRRRFNPNRLSATPSAEVDFIAALDRIQGSARDDDFAKEIDVSVSLLRQTRWGKKRLAPYLLRAGRNIVAHSIYEAASASVMGRVRRKAEKKEKAA